MHIRKNISLAGQYRVKVIRKGQVVQRLTQKNGIVNAGLVDLLDVMFAAGSQSSTWYCGLIDDSGYSALSSLDTMASHAGWAELEDYSESDRQLWTPVYNGSQTYINTSLCAFSIDDTVDLRGIFIVNESTKGGTSGTLWSTASVSSIPLINGDSVQVQYQIRASS